MQLFIGGSLIKPIGVN